MCLSPFFTCERLRSFAFDFKERSLTHDDGIQRVATGRISKSRKPTGSNSGAIRFQILSFQYLRNVRACFEATNGSVEYETERQLELG